jgi:hypothetical protein
MHGVVGSGPGGSGGITLSGGSGAGGLSVVSDEPHTFSIDLDFQRKEAERIDMEACVSFLQAVGIEDNPDATQQLQQVFLPCLRIMNERPWSPDGSTWKRSGVLGILTDVRKKFERLWERGWKHGVRHDDSALDLINYLGMYMRSEDNRWGEWGEPAGAGRAE